MINKTIAYALGLVCMVGSTASAQMWPLSEGTQEIQVGGFVNWNGRNDERTELKLGYGYFIDENFVVGPRFSMGHDSADALFTFDAYTEYHFPVNDIVAPYIGAALGYANNSKAEKSSAVTLSIAGGCKFFIVEDLALDLSLNHTQATERIFLSDLDFERQRTSIEIGLRFFY